MNRLFRNFVLLFVMALSVTVVSCKEDEDPIIDAPTITGLSPTQGLPGTVLTITGTNLANATSLKIGGVDASISNNTATSIRTTVPASLSPGSHSVVVTTAGGSANRPFIVTSEEQAAATITQVSPVSGGAGQEVVITGTNFTGASAVSVGGTAVEGYTVSNDGNTITFTIPEGTTEGYTGVISVTTSAGSVTSAEDLTFTFTTSSNEPTIAVVTPENMTGMVGDQVTITGTNFENAEVFFGSGEDEVAVELDATSTETLLVFNVPENAVSGPITIRTEHGEVQTASFTVETDDGNGNGDSDLINVNGSLEDSDVGEITANLPNWSFNGLGTNATFAITEDEAHEGTKSLAITVTELTTNPWEIEAGQAGLEVEPDTKYTYSIWAKGPEGTSASFTMGATVEHLGSTRYPEIGRQTVEMTGEWVHVTFEFTTTAAIETDGVTDNVPLTVVRAPIHLSIEGNVGETIYVDHLEIKLATEE